MCILVYRINFILFYINVIFIWNHILQDGVTTGFKSCNKALVYYCIIVSLSTVISVTVILQNVTQNNYIDLPVFKILNELL